VDTVTFLPTVHGESVGLSLASINDCSNQTYYSWWVVSESSGINTVYPSFTGQFNANVVVTEYGQHEVCYVFRCAIDDDDDSAEKELEGKCCTTITAEYQHLPVYCDFSTLMPGVPLTQPYQAEILRNDCFMSVETRPGTTTPGSVYSTPPINVFDSSDIISKYPRDDPDLGSPNRACGHILPGGRRGLGRGRGGQPFTSADHTNNPFRNCNELDNLLIIQNENVDASEQANDSAQGGCMWFQFHAHVNLKDFGLLDIEEGATIMVRNTSNNKSPRGSNMTKRVHTCFHLLIRSILTRTFFCLLFPLLLFLLIALQYRSCR
jgi:hypothetical protein